MFLKGNTVIENIDEDNLSRELEIARFRNYGRENFADLVPHKVSYKGFIANSSKFYSIRLPAEISEYFIRADQAPYFMMSEAPILNDIQELLLLKGSEYNFVANFREVKNYYHKWLMQKTPKEKHFLANTIINSVERNFAFQNFYNIALYGIILTYDPTSYNPKKAIELFDRAIEVVQNCNFSARIKDRYTYLLYVYKGFTYLKEYEYLKSLETFKTALKFNSSGVTAFFYSALSARYVDNFDLSYDYLRQVIEYDKSRFRYAISFNQLPLFSYFYQNAIFYNVYTENGFAQLLPDIDFLIRSLYSGESNSMEITYGKLINLDNLRIKEFFNNSVVSEIKFLKEALDQYKLKKNGLIRIVEQIFRDKLVTLIEYVRNLIETHYFEQIKEEIIVFDRQIEQNQRQLTRIKHEMEDSKNKIKLNLQEAASYLEESLTEKSKYLESQIDKLEKSARYNPTQVFYNSIIFTIFVSFVILLVVGIITLLVGTNSEAPTSKVALETALKWAGITFAFGSFISVFTTLSSFWEKASEKKTLSSRLKKVKEAEAEERELIHEDSERRAQVYELKFNERIKTQEMIIKGFIEERENNYQHKYSVAKKEIDQYITPLNDLLKSLNAAG
jgi:CHASE3 domain sensor protein